MAEEGGGGGGFPKIVIWIGVIVAFDVASYAFDWGWILY